MLDVIWYFTHAKVEIQFIELNTLLDLKCMH